MFLNNFLPLLMLNKEIRPSQLIFPSVHFKENIYGPLLTVDAIMYKNI